MSKKFTVTLEGWGGPLDTIIIQRKSGYLSLIELVEAGADWILEEGDVIRVEVES